MAFRSRRRYSRGGYGDWAPYVPVSQRRAQAAREAAQLAKRGHLCSPVVIEGRGIAHTFWGEAWCRNLERYRDYENRLPRGRTYVRNGSVIDLQIRAGEIEARVSGSRVYTVRIAIAPLPAARWDAVRRACAGGVASVVELLSGRLSDAVMQVMTRPGEGLFPAPEEIRLGCSCPDVAVMCKHVAAVLYGVGARLDQRPDLLFTLRGVDSAELIETAVEQPRLGAGPAPAAALAGADLEAVFGIDLAPDAPAARRSPKPRRKRTPAAPVAPAAGKARPSPKPRGKSPTRAVKRPVVPTAGEARPSPKPRGKRTPAVPVKRPVRRRRGSSRG